MHELLRRWMATAGKLALSAGLLWMGVDMAAVAVAAAPAAATPIAAGATDGVRSHRL